jgi:hypothetical protein
MKKGRLLLFSEADVLIFSMRLVRDASAVPALICAALAATGMCQSKRLPA